jgi:hypothetical protein
MLFTVRSSIYYCLISQRSLAHLTIARLARTAQGKKGNESGTAQLTAQIVTEKCNNPREQPGYCSSASSVYMNLRSRLEGMFTRALDNLPDPLQRRLAAFAALYERAGKCRIVDIGFCFFWAGLAFASLYICIAYTWSLGWNAIEFIIANHLRDFGHYGTGAYYPPAIWRPILPTLLVYFVDGLTCDPLLTLQLIAGSSLAIFVVSIYLANRFLWGLATANLGAFLAFTFPAITILLATHIHSISHLVLLAVIGPAIAFSVRALAGLMRKEAYPNLSRFFAAAAIFWGLSCLTRPELILASAMFFLGSLYLALLHARLRYVILPLILFVLTVAPYHVWRNEAAEEYGLLTNKIIYQFYNTQGWIDPAPGEDVGDAERKGYIRALKLYGDPEENSENLFRAMANNPDALERRFVKACRKLVVTLFSSHFSTWHLLVLFLFSPLALWRSTLEKKRIYIFLAAGFSTIGIFLLLTIDQRYITICVPFAILMASFTLAPALDSQSVLPVHRGMILCFLAIFMAVQIPLHLIGMSHSLANTKYDTSHIRQLANGFLKLTRPTLEERKRMMIYLGFPPDRLSRFGEDMFMFYYYSGTANVQLGANDVYPRGRIFSYRSCPFTHGIFFVEPSSQDDLPSDPTVRRLGRVDVSASGSFEIREFLTQDGKPVQGCADYWWAAEALSLQRQR